MTKTDDFNHVIQMTIGDDTKPFTLVPDTSMNEIHVISVSCDSCFNTDNHYYEPAGQPLQENSSKTTVNYFYMLHAYERSISGNHYSDEVCFNDVQDS